jgi:hypothetical protein
MLFQTKKLSSLTPSGIMIHRSCLAPIINTIEDVNHFGKSNNVEEDEENISELKKHMMPPAGVINRSHLFQEVLPIHT